MEKYSEQLALEAVSVGALFIPWTYVVSGVIDRLPLAAFSKTPLSIFIAGAGFHIACEFAGINDYYLKHSAAHMLHMRKWMASCKSKPKSRKKPCGIHFVE